MLSILFFLLLSLSLENYPLYSLVPPHIQTNLSEICSWSLRGSAINLRKQIRMTSISSDYGGLCIRRRTTFHNWCLTLSIKAPAPSANVTYSTYFTNELCIESALIWNGFGLQLSFSPSEILISLQNNNGQIANQSSAQQLCSIPISSSDLLFRITKLSSNFTVEVGHSVNNISFCGSFTSPLEYGFFTIGCNSFFSPTYNDIYSVEVLPLSFINRTKQNDEEDIESREKLEVPAEERSKAKKLRRREMKVCRNYLEQIDLEAPGKESFNDSFTEIKEMVVRARQGLSAEELSAFLDGMVKERLDQAVGRIEYATETLKEIRELCNGVYSSMIPPLRQIKYDVDSSLEQMKKDAYSVAQQLLNRSDVEVPRIGSPNGSSVLYLICVVEFATFMILSVIRVVASKKLRTD